ncbi:hypothetical protein PMAYCL1PPCAC_23633, partial [Pristionchus mayeri]
DRWPFPRIASLPLSLLPPLHLLRMVFGCLRRCGMNSSDDDLVPYERAGRETVRLESVSPLSPPTQPPLEHQKILPSDPTLRKTTIASFYNETGFNPEFCSTRIAGSTAHHRSNSAGAVGSSFYKMCAQ